MDVDDIKASAPTVGEPGPSFAQEFQSYCERLPDKGFFFLLLAAWLVMFQFFGTATFNYSTTPSLFQWLYNAWDTPMLDSGHGKLIPFAVLILLWVRRRELADTISGWWWPAIGLIGVALALHVFGFLVQQPRVSVVSLFFGIYSLVGLVWGWKTLKASFFPFVLFAFCMPFGTFIENLTLPLRLFSTSLTFAICHGGLDVPLYRNGTNLFDPTMTINYDVAPACSGIRSFVALLAVTTIFSVLSFKPIWKRAAMIAMTIPLVIFFNVLRLVTIILATQSINREAGLFVHEWFGFCTYMMAVACLLGVAHFLKDKPLTVAA
jgi:exosortase